MSFVKHKTKIQSLELIISLTQTLVIALCFTPTLSQGQPEGLARY